MRNLAVHVGPFALCMVSNGWRLRLPEPPVTMLHFVLKGHGAVRGPREDGGIHRLASSWLAVVPNGAKHALESGGKIEHELRIDAPPGGESVTRLVAGSPDDPGLVVACGLVTVRYGQSFGLFDHLHEVLAVNLADQPQVGAAFQTILAEQHHPGLGGETMTGALMTACLVHMLRRLASESGGALPWLDALRDRRLARAIDRILANPAAHHTVESLAEAALMSRSAFAEHFAAAFRRSPMSFVHHIRMQRAAQLLQEGSLSIDEVVARVGFSSRSHFSHAFKQHTGAPPGEFRAR